MLALTVVIALVPEIVLVLAATDGVLSRDDMRASSSRIMTYAILPAQKLARCERLNGFR